MNNGARPRSTTAAALFVALALALAGGCAQPSESNRERATEAAAPAISVRVVDADQYQQTLSKLRGKVVLVDFWATWCAPCVKQFPHTVSLERKYKGRGLAAISISLDDPSEEAQVRDFLQKQDARFDNLLSKYAPEDIEAAVKNCCEP
jgi:thiol-disulfide isomerase/thioredoxin